MMQNHFAKDSFTCNLILRKRTEEVAEKLFAVLCIEPEHHLHKGEATGERACGMEVGRGRHGGRDQVYNLLVALNTPITTWKRSFVSFSPRSHLLLRLTLWSWTPTKWWKTSTSWSSSPSSAWFRTVRNSSLRLNVQSSRRKGLTSAFCFQAFFAQKVERECKNQNIRTSAFERVSCAK